MQQQGTTRKKFKSFAEYREFDRERKQAKVDKLVNRARACRTFDGLQKVGDDARSMGLWDADHGKIRREFSKCNGRLRGREVPARWTKDGKEVIVSDDKVKSMPWIRTRQLSNEGWLYGGQTDDKQAD